MKAGPAAALFFVLAGPAYSQEPMPFEIPEVEKKPFTLAGYAELRTALFVIDRGSTLYKVRLFDRQPGRTVFEAAGQLLLDAKYERGAQGFFLRTASRGDSSYLGESQGTTIYEGFFSLKPSVALTTDLGKKTLKWGKGYAWNPVAFLDRPKNPEDAELALEGLIVVSADYIKSFRGRLKTFSFTPVLVPVYDGVNDKFGRLKTLGFAAKWYFLYDDTDVDLILLTGDTKSTRYGIDFSRNITTNFEVHGEFAWIEDFVKPAVDAAGRIVPRTYDSKSYLVGARYLTKSNITFIVEYYHNGTGYTPDEMRNFFALVDRAYDAYTSTGDSGALAATRNLLEGGYGRQNPMRDYLFLRASQPDAFGTLYLTPGLIWTLNLNDGSFALTQEMTYKPATNLELRTQLSFIAGGRRTEYGGRQADIRADLRIRSYF